MFGQDAVLWPLLLVMRAMLTVHFENFCVCVLYHLCLLDLIHVDYLKLVADSKTHTPKDKQCTKTASLPP